MAWEAISPDTNLALQRAAAEHRRTYGGPQHLRLGSFVTLHADIEKGRPETLIEAEPHRLTILMDGAGVQRRLWVIDLAADQPASFVDAAAYDDEGWPDPDPGESGGDVQGVLSDIEGRALVSDLQNSTAVVQLEQRAA